MNTEKIKEVLEDELGEQLNICSVEFQNGRYYAEMEFYSDAGEDFVFTVWFDGTWSDFCDNFRQYVIDFDPDEHAEMWVNSRGKNGVPDSIRTLIDDADSILEYLEKWSDNLEYDKYDDNWEVEEE